MQDFEILPHTADIKIRVFGKDKRELFKNALIGMFQSIHPIIEGATIKNDRFICVDLPIQRKVNVASNNEIGLLVDFLSEALYLSDIYNEAYLDAVINNLNEKNINATLLGIPIKGFEVVEIKAVTYHDLSIKKINDIWQTDIVF